MDIKVHRFSCKPPETPYAPVWDYVIAEKKIDIDVEELSRLILSNKRETIAHFFNVLQWEDQVCKDLLKEIKEFHAQYIKNTCTGFDPKLKVRSWANIMNKGQKIEKHYHSSMENSYLSGHFCVKCDDSATNYYHPYDMAATYPFKNEPNLLTLFPTWIPHDTTTHKGDSERISIAFDIMLESTPLDNVDTFAGDVAYRLQNDETQLVYL